MKSKVAALALAAAPLACRTQGPAHPTNVQIPVPDSQPQGQGLEPTREAPPESFPPRETPFPKIDHQDLPNGLGLDVVAARTLPLVQIRVLVKSGAAADGDMTGLANVTAKMLKDGGAGRWSSKELLAKVETLGADLGIEVGPDSTVLSLAVAKAHFDEAIDLLGTVVREPR